MSLLSHRMAYTNRRTGAVTSDFLIPKAKSFAHLGIYTLL